jgi:hypothetical protein
MQSKKKIFPANEKRPDEFCKKNGRGYLSGRFVSSDIDPPSRGMSDFLCGPAAACDRRVHGSVIPADIRGFAGEEQGVVHWPRQSFLGITLTGLPVAIGSPREWIILPVVKVSVFKQSREFLRTHS